jgi:hypothetical protein
MTNGLVRQRFLAVWLGFALLYMVLAALGHGGLRQTGSWPEVNQHLLQVRAWRGEDIVLTAPDGSSTRVIAVDPRLDVTPYFTDWVIDDPRERVLLTNLAVGVRDDGGQLQPVRYLPPDTLAARLQMERLECHVGSPLGPAFLMYPLSYLFGGALATQWLAAILGGLAVALADLLIGWCLDVLRGSGAVGSYDRGRLLALAGLGTLWIWLVPQGEVWMFAQTTATCALTMCLVLAWRRRWLWSGLAFGLAIASRPPVLLALPLMVAIVGFRVRTGFGPSRSPWRALVVAGLFPVLIGVGHLALNQARFGSPLDFGYRYQLTPPELRERIEAHGTLSLAHLPRNIRYTLLQPPVLVRDSESGTPRFPFLVSDPRGMGVFFVTPAFLMILLTVHGRWRAPGLMLASWISLCLVLTPSMLFYNTGWVQWGGRYLLDAWPLLLILTALGVHRIGRRTGVVLIVLSVISNLWATLLTVGGWWPT